MSTLMMNMNAANDALAPALPDDAEAPLRALRRRGLALLLLGFGGFLAWAAWAPIDQAVAGQGTLVVAGQRKTVQHAEGGTVARLMVEEGQAVQRGQVLLSLETGPQRAELRSLEHQLLAQRAAAERLRALLDGRSVGALAFGAALRAEAAALGEEGLRSLQIQRDLYASQRLGSGHEGRELQARQAQLQAELSGRAEQLERQREQRGLAEQQLATLEDLAREGFYPRLRLLDAQRQSLAARQEEERGRAEIARGREALAEARALAGRRGGELKRDWEQELLAAERLAAQLEPRIAALRHQIGQAEIAAPVSGRVVALAAHTVGGVVKAGERLMDIVPQDEALVVEARFPLGAGEKLAPGQRAELRFTSMDQNRTPSLAGEVLTVSADKLEDGRSGAPYLLVRLGLPAAERARLADAGAALRPGLPVEVFVALGERSLLGLLTKPLGDRLRRGFTD